MRICLINSVPNWGGGERVFLELAVGFQEAGHAVTLVCRPGSVLAVRVPSGVDAMLARCGGYFDAGTLVRLLRLFGSRRFDAVFCNTGRDCFLAGMAALPSRMPVIRIRQLERTGRSLHRVLIHRWLLSAVVSVSRAAQDGLAALGVPPERLFVIHNGIDVKSSALGRAVARRHAGVADGDFVVAYAGRLAREKGADLLPEIAARLRAAGIPLRLLVAGAGPLRDDLQRRCGEGSLAGAMSLLGFLDDPLPLLSAADAAVMPSREESFGVAAIEALAAGVPLVATRVGGLREILVDEESALLVPPDDAGAAAAALERIHHDTTLAARLRERGRARAQEFSRARMIAAYEDLVRQLQGRQRSARGPSA